MNHKVPQVIVVDWDDAFISSHRHTTDTFLQCPECQNCKLSTVGFLVARTKEKRIVQASEQIGYDEFKNFSSTPQSNIIRMHYYKLARTVEYKKEGHQAAKQRKHKK